MTGSIFFITGASGTGKSTLAENLKQLCIGNKSYIEVYDFDEDSVPKNPTAYWRQEQTNRWLIKAISNAQNNISTVICGVVVPLEVLGSSEFVSGIPIYFAGMYVDSKLQRKRLLARGWPSKLIKSDANWSAVLKMCVEKEKGFLFDATKSSPSAVAHVFNEWIMHCIDSY